MDYNCNGRQLHFGFASTVVELNLANDDEPLMLHEGSEHNSAFMIFAQGSARIRG